MTDPSNAWPDRIYDALEALDVGQVSYVPDAGHKRLIERCQASAMTSIGLTTEEEGVALAAGAWLGGVRSALLMQSSGVGNCINMLGLLQTCRCPLLMLVTMRGEFGEFNPWQVPMGQASAEVMRALGVLVERLDQAEDAFDVASMMGRMAFEGQRPAAVLIGQRLIGAKTFGR